MVLTLNWNKLVLLLGHEFDSRKSLFTLAYSIARLDSDMYVHFYSDIYVFIYRLNPDSRFAT